MNDYVKAYMYIPMGASNIVNNVKAWGRAAGPGPRPPGLGRQGPGRCGWEAAVRPRPFRLLGRGHWDLGRRGPATGTWEGGGQARNLGHAEVDFLLEKYVFI